MRAASRPIRPTRKSAPGGPATTRSSASCSIRARSATRPCSRPSGRATIRRRACARATTSAPSTAPASTSTSPEQRRVAEASRDAYQPAHEGALRRDHDRDRRRARVLLRRGLSPAVPGEEPVGVLRPRRHGRELPDGRVRLGGRRVARNVYRPREASDPPSRVPIDERFGAYSEPRRVKRSIG